MEALATLIAAIVLAVGSALVLAVFWAVLIALPVMWLWDYVMPALFGLKEITFLQALCLSFLCSLLFKSSCDCKKEDDD